jgi:hypothetical protein
MLSVANERSLLGNHLRNRQERNNQLRAGYHPLYMFAKSLASAVHLPFILSPVALMYGYVTAYLKGVPRVNDPECGDFNVRRYTSI